MTTWRLTNAERDPTSEVPPIQDRMSLKVDDIAKIIFESTLHGYLPERMWVIITEVHEPGKYTGKVDSRSLLNLNLPKMGELVQFEARNIISVIHGLCK